MLYNILAVVLAVALLVLIIYLITLVNQIRKTAQSAERVLNSLESEVRPLIIELKETATQANRISTGAREGVDRINSFLESVEEIGKTVTMVNSVVRGSSTTVLISLAALSVGIRQGLKVFIKGLIKGGGTDE